MLPALVGLDGPLALRGAAEGARRREGPILSTGADIRPDRAANVKPGQDVRRISSGHRSSKPLNTLPVVDAEHVRAVGKGVGHPIPHQERIAELSIVRQIIRRPGKPVHGEPGADRRVGRRCGPKLGVGVDGVFRALIEAEEAFCSSIFVREVDVRLLVRGGHAHAISPDPPPPEERICVAGGLISLAVL